MNRLPRVLQNEIWEYVHGDRPFWKQQFRYITTELGLIIHSILSENPTMSILQSLRDREGNELGSVHRFYKQTKSPGESWNDYIDFWAQPGHARALASQVKWLRSNFGEWSDILRQDYGE